MTRRHGRSPGQLARQAARRKARLAELRPLLSAHGWRRTPSGEFVPARKGTP